MKEVTTVAESFFSRFQAVKKLGVIHAIDESEVIQDGTVTVSGEKISFFGNCSYLGLELDERVKQKSIEAILKYGTVFSSSRTYISLSYLHEVEEKLAQIFEKPVLIPATTGLGHIAWIPLLATKGDVIILDHQVHRSVQNAVQMVKANGVVVEMVRHNRMDLLEEKIIALSKEYRKVWYMADSVYSMYGDVAPLHFLEKLMNKYEQFYVYIDDAHGMSWAGKHGRGYVLNEVEYHPKMCLATSLVKGFGANAAALVFPDQQMKEMVQLTGSPFIFSGPPAPAALGAIEGAADIHLSEEIYTKQDQLKTLMEHFVKVSHSLNLPLIKDDLTPVFFIGIGVDSHKNEVASYIARDMMKQGYFVNVSSYPSVPLKNEGLRFTMSNHHTKEDVENMLKVLASILDQYGLRKEAILPAFETKKQRKRLVA